MQAGQHLTWYTNSMNTTEAVSTCLEARMKPEIDRTCIYHILPTY